MHLSLCLYGLFGWVGKKMEKRKESEKEIIVWLEL
jgi:hypothetical protein